MILPILIWVLLVSSHEIGICLLQEGGEPQIWALLGDILIAAAAIWVHLVQEELPRKRLLTSPLQGEEQKEGTETTLGVRLKMKAVLPERRLVKWVCEVTNHDHALLF